MILPVKKKDILPESDDEDEDNVVQQDKQRATLYAEKSLCELSSKMVLAIIGRVLDNEGPSKGGSVSDSNIIGQN